MAIYGHMSDSLTVQVTVRLRDRVVSSLGRGLRVRDRVGVRVRTLF